jgi:hypothetical protein
VLILRGEIADVPCYLHTVRPQRAREHVSVNLIDDNIALAGCLVLVVQTLVLTTTALVTSQFWGH